MMQGLYRELFNDIPEAKEDKELLAKVIEGVELHNPGKSPADIFALVPEAYRKAKGLNVNISSIDMSKLNETVNGVL